VIKKEEDLDGNDQGDVCDSDDDNDSVGDVSDVAPSQNAHFVFI